MIVPYVPIFSDVVLEFSARLLPNFFGVGKLEAPLCCVDNSPLVVYLRVLVLSSVTVFRQRTVMFDPFAVNVHVFPVLFSNGGVVRLAHRFAFIRSTACGRKSSRICSFPI